MQQGLTLVWLLSLGVSLVAWLYLEITKMRVKSYRSRRQITGCELARQVLDRQGPNRIAVAPLSGATNGEFRFSSDRLFLTDKVYYGQRLFDVTEALFSATRHLELSDSVVPMEWRSPGGKIWQGVVTSSWILIAAGLVWQGAGWLTASGRILLIAAFFMALAYLASDWKSAERALSSLVSLEGFGVDEKVRMKKILEAVRWTSLAGLIRAPWEFLAKRIRFELPKSERVH